MKKEQKICYFCDACIAPIVAEKGDNEKWKLYRTKIGGMGIVSDLEHLQGLSDESFDEVIPFNTFDGISHIAVCKDEKWGLIRLVSGEEPIMLAKWDFAWEWLIEMSDRSLEEIRHSCDLNKNVEDLIIASLTELKTIGSESDATRTTSNLIFPQYYVGKHQHTVRISEQEARFLFVRQLETDKTHSFYYAVEAPTKKAYQFSENKKKIDPVMKDTGQSGNIDVCLFVYNEENKKFQRKHLIEFKFGNSEQENYSTDLLKLLFDDDGLTNYFFNIVSVKDLLKRNTKPSIEKKYSAAINAYIDIEQTKSKDLRFFLFNINDGRLIQYRIINNQLQPN
jgi:hypothetical protein